MKEGESLHLKKNLFENLDFKAIPFKAWKYLSSWYDVDLSIMRTMSFDQIKQ